MEAAHITWRPLGQLFVERGLITQDELEEALVEQRETRKRLGAILVARGLVSGPELTSVLVDQLGMELTKESGFGSGLWDEIRRRHPSRRTQPPAGSTNGDAEPDDSEPAEAPFADEPQADVPPAHEPPPVALVEDPPAPAPAFDPAEVKAELARQHAEFAVAQDVERAELQAALSAERAALESALAEERAAREQAIAELAEVRAEAGARTAELGELATQVADLRTQIEQSTAKVAAERDAVERRPGLEERVAELDAELEAERARSRAADERAQDLASRLAEAEAALEAEQTTSRDNAAELEQARGEASAEAKQLRESIERLRGELDQLDAATAWFEYWSGAASPGQSSA